MQTLWRLVICSVRGHDLCVMTHPAYLGLALCVCRRCGRGDVRGQSWWGG